MRFFKRILFNSNAYLLFCKRYGFHPNETKFIIKRIYPKFFMFTGLFGASIISYHTYKNNQYGIKFLPEIFAEDRVDKEILETKIKEAIDIIQRVKDESGSPGISVCVTINGKEILNQGFGYADLENRVPCTEKTVMRIASLSKSLTMAIAARLIDLKKLDIDKPIQEYVPDWPMKSYDGEKVEITTKQLMSHLGGVRHYDKTCKKHKEMQAKRISLRKSNLCVSNDQVENLTNDKEIEKQPKNESDSVLKTPEIVSKEAKNSNKGKIVKVDDHAEAEFYSKRNFKSVKEALSLFQNDNLCSKPGTEYLYTTHGYTLLSAVMESASGYKFSVLFQQMVKELGLKDTFLDEYEPLIYHRSRNYVKNNRGWVVNAPYVDNSLKWAGGGMVSTAKDMVDFGNAMLYSYQSNNNTDTILIKGETMKMIWTPVKNTRCDWDDNAHYALGWCADFENTMISHTGGAVGASSVLVISPENDSQIGNIPKGIVISIISNLSSVGLFKSALKICHIFKDNNF